jgi:hypothetical protein
MCPSTLNKVYPPHLLPPPTWPRVQIHITLRYRWGVGFMAGWKGNNYLIFWLCVSCLSYPVCNVHAPYYHFGPVWLYHIFLQRNFWEEKKYWTWKMFFDFLYIFLYFIYIYFHFVQLTTNVRTGQHDNTINIQTVYTANTDWLHEICSNIMILANFITNRKILMF